MEHIRIAQKDIIDYALNAEWKSLDWPDEYWPGRIETLTQSTWENSVDGFFADLQRVKDLVNDKNIDLTAEIPWGEGRTYLRQVLLVADHNAYHISKIVMMRKILQNW